MYLNETYVKKWAPVLDHSELPAIQDQYKRAVTALVLENQEKALMEEARGFQGLWETSPANSMGATGMGATGNGLGAYNASTAGAGIAGFAHLLTGSGE